MIKRFICWLLGYTPADEHIVAGMALTIASLSQQLNKAVKHICELQDEVESHHSKLKDNVKNHLAEMQGNPNRNVCCPKCGKSFNLVALNVPHYTRSVTISCDGCKSHFDVRPGMFWESFEVSAR